MKRTLALLFAVMLFMGVGCGDALAVICVMGEPLSSAYEPLDMPAEVSLNEEYVKTGRQYVYVPVTVFTHNIDGTISQTFITPRVLLVVYQYIVSYSPEAGIYTGGSVMLNTTYPYLIVDDQSSMGLNVSCARVSYPVVAYVEGNGASYTVHIRGGSITITYDAVIHQNSYGVITSRESTTVIRAYNFSETGS